MVLGAEKVFGVLILPVIGGGLRIFGRKDDMNGPVL